MVKKDDKDFKVLEAEVIESLPNTLFLVKVSDPSLLMNVETNVELKILCYVSGRMRKNFIKILPGDKVRVEISPYDIARGRIVYRV